MRAPATLAQRLGDLGAIARSRNPDRAEHQLVPIQPPKERALIGSTQR
jgi:hypothetical protein